MSRVMVVAFVLSGWIVPLTAPLRTWGQAAQPDASPPVTPAPAATVAPAAPVAPVAPAPAGATTRPGNQSAEEMLKQMLQPQGESAPPLRPAPEQPPALDSTGGDAAVAPDAAPQALIREGTPLLDRVGRLTPIAKGQMMELTLDADGSILADAPLVLLPSRKLMALEDRVKTSYRDLKISVSGEVTEYRGRNYLLLSRWSVVQDVVQPLR